MSTIHHRRRYLFLAHPKTGRGPKKKKIDDSPALLHSAPAQARLLPRGLSPASKQCSHRQYTSTSCTRTWENKGLPAPGASCHTMASNFRIQKPYVLTALPRPIESSCDHYVVGDVYGQQQGSKRKRRSELAVGINGEATNIYDVGLMHAALPLLLLLLTSRTGSKLPPHHFLPYSSAVDFYMPSLLNPLAVFYFQICISLYIHIDS